MGLTVNYMIFGQHDQNTLDQLKEIENDAVRVALMADGHYGYVMPVGGVAAYDNKVSVPGVGFDIACGNCAIKTDLKLSQISKGQLTVEDITNNPHRVVTDPWLLDLANNIKAGISFGIGRANQHDDAPEDHPLFLDEAWYAVPNVGSYRDDLKDKARRQLGTVGSGNHYVDVFVDRQTNDVWVGVHFGSRGLGHTIATNFLAIGQGGRWGDKGKEVQTLLNLDTAEGQEYWALMNLAGRYAYAGREWVTRTVVKMMGGEEVDMVHNHHNFAWKETHHIGNNEFKELIVVRKGATPAFPKQKGFVGGSMGDDAVILEGETMYGITDPSYTKNLSSQETALYSTVHGAGRVMSRTEAAGKRDRRTGKLKKDQNQFRSPSSEQLDEDSE